MTEKNEGMSASETQKFISEVSHELRNLVSIIRGEAQLGLIKFENSGTPERMKVALGNIMEHTDLMIVVLEEKLDAYRKKGR
jgi:signal transduction histidine kinase